MVCRLLLDTVLLDPSHDHEASILHHDNLGTTSTNIDSGVSRLGTFEAPKLPEFIPNSVRLRPFFIVVATVTLKFFRCLENSSFYVVLLFVRFLRIIVIIRRATSRRGGP